MKVVNGEKSWIETHHEIVAAITLSLENDSYLQIPTIAERYEAQGTGGMYELAEELTDKFEKTHAGWIWDGNFFDEIESFLTIECPSV